MILDQFVMGSWWHGLYIIAPIVLTLILYFLLRKRSYTTRYIVGIIIGIASLGVLIMRNVDIYLDHGFDPEIIPLQVCHFGNIFVFLTLVFRSKTTGAAAISLNMIAAFVSHIEAQSLTHYQDVWSIRAQAYIWGHLLIVVGSLYAVMLKIVRLRWKDFFAGSLLIICFLIPSIVMNSYFNDKMAGSFNHINYFYVYDSDGVPFEFLYGIVERSKYGWFTIDWVYTLSVIGLGFVVMAIIFAIPYFCYFKQDFETHHIFYNLVHKKKLEPVLEGANEENKEEVLENKKEEINETMPMNYIKVTKGTAKYNSLTSEKANVIIVRHDEKK